MMSEFDVVIVGMGPAGMAAATELAACGLRIAVVDENPRPGGQIYRQPAEAFHMTDPVFPGQKHRSGRQLIDHFNRVSEKFEVFSDTCAWGFFEPDILAVTRKDRVRLLRCKKLLLAEGAMERSIPFPGWTLPGVMTLGGLSKMVLNQRLLPGRRFLLGGCSPLLLPVAAALVENGAEKVIICDAVPPRKYLGFIPEVLRQKGLARQTFAGLLSVLKSRVTWRSPYSVTAAEGENRVQEVTVTRMDGDLPPAAASGEKFEVDVAAVSYGFLPAARLVRLCGCDHRYDPLQACWKPVVDERMRTSRPEVYVAGDSSGIGGASLAEIEGRIAALAMAGGLGLPAASGFTSRMAGLTRQRDRLKNYVTAFNRVFAPPPELYRLMNRDTVVCRCEKVTAGEVLDGIASGCRNINQIKRTRAGMGLCQARTCESIVAALMTGCGIPAEEVGYLRLRPPLSPIPSSFLQVLADRPGDIPSNGEEGYRL